MPCYYPLKVYRSSSGRDASTGKWPISFSYKNGYRDLELQIPCGQCIGCRLERSRKWAIRCINEASLYENNCFITLTYNDQNLPSDGSLQLEHYQKFMKRLRKKFGENIRFFHCGEYGEKENRPHYHAILFNFDFKDKKLFAINKKTKVKYFISEDLKKLWPYGYHYIGDVTFESSAYVARYIMKKVTGDMAKDHYKGRQPEYITMSRRPGIGAEWIKKYHSDVYPQDQVIIRENLKVRPPKFYDRKFDEMDHKTMNKIMLQRQAQAKKNPLEKEVLDRKRKYKEIQIKQLVRRLE